MYAVMRKFKHARAISSNKLVGGHDVLPFLVDHEKDDVVSREKGMTMVSNSDNCNEMGNQHGNGDEIISLLPLLSHPKRRACLLADGCLYGCIARSLTISHSCVDLF